MSAAEQYRQRLQAREAQVCALQRAVERTGGLRLLIVITGALGAWGALQFHPVSPAWLLVPLAIFAAAVIYHSRVRRARMRAERAAAVYRRGLARIEDRWAGQGPTGERFNDPHHVYAADLDLFGDGSLFQLLSAARTRMGEEALARWLLSPAGPGEIAQRQAAVTELGSLLDLREDLAVMGEDQEVGVQPQALLQWAEASNVLTQPWLRPIAWGMPLLAMAGVMIWSVWGLASPFVLILAIAAAVLRLLGKRLQEVMSTTENAFDDLKLLAGMLMRLEEEPLKAARLQQLQTRLSSSGMQASAAISRLATVVQMVESRRNPILALLQTPLMYPLHVALAAERWRAGNGRAVRAWLDTLGELEALISLGIYGYEHPDDPFPQFIDGPATLQGEKLGHPLIPADRCVRNDVSIAGETRVLLVSGSNMSGKSTLLRTVGTNTVLAMAGAPVRASRLQLTPLQVGASIRINDSLHEGSSRFYAEITRLRQLHDSSQHSPPLLFLLDEVLQGTNSRDRRIGAEGVVRAFLERGAIGMVSTHDLALADIDIGGGQRLRNLHFQDDLVDGRMRFDFRLRDGVVTKSNGIELMRSIGLSV